MSNSEIIGANIKRYRKRANLSQRRLSSLIERSPSYMSTIESGKRVPSLKVLLLVAEKLNVEPGYLLLENPDEISGDPIVRPALRKLIQQASQLDDTQLEELTEFAEVIARRNRST